LIDYYEVLGVEPCCSTQELKKSFRKKAKELHPDLGNNNSSSDDAAMKLLIKAYTVLSNPEKRREYDREISFLRNKKEFNYQSFLKERTHDPLSQSKLVFYDLLHDYEDEAIHIYEQMTSVDKWFLETHMEREDFMDCAFLLAEEYERRNKYIEAYNLLTKIVEYETQRPYFRHFMDEVISKLKSIACFKMAETLEPEIQIWYLHDLIKYNFSRKLNAFLYKKIAELHLDMGNKEKARYYIKKSLELDYTDMKSLRKKTSFFVI